MNSTQWNKIRYTVYSPFYDVVEKVISKGRKQALHLLSPKNGEKILLVGCGTGLDLEYLNPQCDITAIDISPSMVARAKKRAQQKGIKARCIPMNAEKLQFNDNEFDCVVLHLILAVIPDPIACIKEAERVLKKDGRISIFDKFLKKDEQPSIFRKVMNIFSSFFFTDINRKLEPIISSANLEMIKYEPSLFGGFFIAAVAQKNN